MVFHYATFTVISGDLCCYMCNKSWRSDVKKVVKRDGMNLGRLCCKRFLLACLKCYKSEFSFKRKGGLTSFNRLS